MGQAISEVLPFAVGVAISPIPLIAVILMLFTPRAKANGVAFLLGWAVGLALLSAIVYALSDAGDIATDSTAADTVATGKIVLGAFLLLGGLRRWRARPRTGADVVMPRWMAGVDGFGPTKAGALGLGLSTVNPKNLLLTLGAATGVASLGGSTADAVVGLGAFVVLASSTTAVAVAYRIVGGARSEAALNDAKQWLTIHNEAVMAVLFVVFGVVLIANGLRPLTA